MSCSPYSDAPLLRIRRQIPPGETMIVSSSGAPDIQISRRGVGEIKSLSFLRIRLFVGKPPIDLVRSGLRYLARSPKLRASHQVHFLAREAGDHFLSGIPGSS